MKQNKIGSLVIRDREYKVGDVIRWVSAYELQSEVEKRGLGIVVEASDDTRMVKTYWTGDKKIRETDSLLMCNDFILQDYAPIPQIAEAIELARAAGLVTEEDYCERVL